LFCTTVSFSASSQVPTSARLPAMIGSLTCSPCQVPHVINLLVHLFALLLEGCPSPLVGNSHAQLLIPLISLSVFRPSSPTDHMSNASQQNKLYCGLVALRGRKKLGGSGPISSPVAICPPLCQLITESHMHYTLF
jgi:hypothetical protein